MSFCSAVIKKIATKFQRVSSKNYYEGRLNRRIVSNKSISVLSQSLNSCSGLSDPVHWQLRSFSQMNHNITKMSSECAHQKSFASSSSRLVFGFLLLWAFRKAHHVLMLSFGVKTVYPWGGGFNICLSICKIKGNNEGWSSWQIISSTISCTYCSLLRALCLGWHQMHKTIQWYTHSGISCIATLSFTYIWTRRKEKCKWGWALFCYELSFFFQLEAFRALLKKSELLRSS